MSVYKRKDTKGTRWYFDFSIKGVRYKKALPHVTSKREALDIEAKARRAVYEGKDKQAVYDAAYNKPAVAPPMPTVAQFIESHYMPYSKINKRSHYDDIRITQTLCDYFGEMRLDSVMAADVERFKQERRAGITKYKRERSPATVNRELGVLSRILSLAVEAELISFNSRPRIRRLRAASGRIRYLSTEEEARLFEAIGDDWRLAAIVTLALHTGMRRGEIFKLEWKHVDFVRKIINVQDTKSGHDRVIPMSTVIEDMLQSLPRTSEYVFISDTTNANFFDVKLNWQRAKKAAGLVDFRFHDLRHTAATRMADAGADAFTIMSILGHTTFQMSARYTHATDEAKRRAVERLADYRKIRPAPVPKNGVETLTERKKHGFIAS